MPNLRTISAFAIYTSIALAAIWTSHSTSGLVVTGLGSILLVDKLVFQLLPSRHKRSWRRELALRATFCVLGAVAFFFCHGEQDELAPFGDALALYDRYQGPKSCYWVPGGSHYDLRQRHRDEYLARFRHFIESCIVAKTGSSLAKN